MKKRKRLLWALILVATLLVVTPVILIWHHGNSFPTKQADTLIVLGCRLYGDIPSLLLRYRLDKALELYELGLANHIIVSGAMGPGETVTEAYAMKKYLMERGVDEEYVHMEDRSYSTYENLKYSKEIMDELSLTRAIVVSSDFHIFRSLVIARMLGITATGAPSGLPDIFGMRTKYVLREVPAFYREVFLR